MSRLIFSPPPCSLLHSWQTSLTGNATVGRKAASRGINTGQATHLSDLKAAVSEPGDDVSLPSDDLPALPSEIGELRQNWYLKRRENGRNVTSFWAWPLWPATWVGYELGGSAPHQCR